MDSKVCTDCKRDLPLDAYSPAKQGLFGRYSKCRECKGKRTAAHRAANLDACRARDREAKRRAHAADPDKYRARHRDWYHNGGGREWSEQYKINNAEHIKAKRREHYDANAERLREVCREYRAANRENVRERARKWAEANPGEHTRLTQERFARLEAAGFYYSHSVPGITFFHQTTYNEIVAEQGGGCPICLRRTCPVHDRLVLDHDHETQLPRGFPCQFCNTHLRVFENDPETFAKMTAYILRTYNKRHQWKCTERLGPWRSTHPCRPGRSSARREAFKAWSAERGNACEMCGITEKEHGRRLHREHCHVRGCYRGLACDPHNLALAAFHQPAIIARARDYLLRTSDPEHQRALFERLRAPYEAWKIEDRERRREASRLAA